MHIHSKWWLNIIFYMFDIDVEAILDGYIL